MSDFVSLEDDKSPEAHGAGSNSGYVSMEDDTPTKGPPVMRAMPDKQSEADYQMWVASNLFHDNGPNKVDSPQFHTPGMGDRTVTVDPYGNGVGVDLRAIFQNHSQPQRAPYQRSVDVTPDMLDRYATPDSPTLTADSVYAKGQPAEKLGFWDTDDDGKSVYRPAGWKPQSTTDKIMSGASKAASDAYDSVSQGLKDPQTWKDFVSPTKALDNGLDAAGELAKGLGGSFNQLGTLGTMAGAGGAVIADKVASIFTGKDQTSAQDWMFDNTVQPMIDRQQAFEVAKDAGLTSRLANGVGGVIGVLDQAILTGPQVAVEGLLARAGIGAASMSVPAVTEATDVGRKVYEQTGDRAAALKAATAAYITTTASGAVPAAISGNLATRLASGAAIGAGTSEANRRAMNAALPDSMQTPYSPEQSVEGAILGAGFGAVHGAQPAAKTAPNSGDTGKPFDIPPGSPPPNGLPGPTTDYSNPSNVYNDYMSALTATRRAKDTAPAQAQVDKFRDAAERAAASGNQGLADQLHDMADRLERVTGLSTEPPQSEGPPALPAPTAAEKAQAVAEAAHDPADVKVDHGVGGSLITVMGEPVAHADTPMEANRIATDAKQQIDERRIDAAQRKKVDDMTPEEMRQALLTHELTNMPNWRAWKEADKKPAVASIDVDGLGWVNNFGHEAGDAYLKTFGQAMQEAAGPDAFHKSGDEFIMQADDHSQLEQRIQSLRDKLADVKLTFTHKDGRVATVNGIDFSHGSGATYEEADSKVDEAKTERQRLGLRGAKGEPPRGTSVTSGEGGFPADQDRASPEPQKVTPTDREPKSSETPISDTPTDPLEHFRQERDALNDGSNHARDGDEGKLDALQTVTSVSYDHDRVLKAAQWASENNRPDILNALKERSELQAQQSEKNRHNSGLSPTHRNYQKSLEALGKLADEARQQANEVAAIQMRDETKPSEGETQPPQSETGEPQSETEGTSAETEGTSAETEATSFETRHPDLSEAESGFVDTVGDRTRGERNQKPIANLVEARKLYEQITGTKLNPATLKRVDELIERAIVESARAIVEDGDEPGVTFDRLVKLYERQPSLNTRTSTSIENQAYSTPAPLAYVASDLGGITHHTTVLEPTAGNGMLLIAADPAMAIVNELNPERAASLKGQGFDVTQKNAVDTVLGKDIDVLIANPPFGVVKDADGKSIGYQLTTPKGESVKTNEIDHAIVLKQLEAMKGDGRAVLLIGGVNKLAKTPEARSDAYNGAAKRKFFYHLYNNYNVVDHFTVAGELYSKQGAAWPIDVIVIHGVGKSALDLPAAAPPRVYASYPELKGLLGKSYDSHRVDTASEAAARPSGGGAGVPEAKGPEQGNLPAPSGGENPADGGLVPRPEGGGERTGAGDVRGRPASGDGELPARAGGEPADLQQLGRVGEADESGRVGSIDESETPTSRELDGAPSPEERPGRSDGTPEVVGESDGSGGVGAQEPYKPASKLKSLGTLVPGNMRDSIGASLKSLEREHGPADAFVAKEMGWKPSEIGDKLAAEQVDALALALKQIKAGKGFIIGDQTGIGKGRVVASVIQWSVKHGYTPIFMTEKPKLYGDMVRDLRDIGAPDIRPLMTNAGEKIPLSDEDPGDVLRSSEAAKHNKILQAAVNDAKLADHNMVFTTYDQMNMQGGKSALRHDLVSTLTPNAILILDESHNAGGTTAGRTNKKKGDKAGEKTGRAGFIRGLVGRSQGVFYSSATYAKRPDVMDLYFKTDMALAVAGNVSKLPAAIQAGGVPLQQIVASMLAESGQYIRRERSFQGVRYETPVSPVQRAAAEAISSMMLKVKEFDDLKEEAVERVKKRAKKDAATVSVSGEAGLAGAQSTNFTSLMHNLISQMLLSLKADAAADHAIEALKRGEKPVLTVANTMGSFIKDYAQAAGLKTGDAIKLGFKDLMNRYLESSRIITIKNFNGEVIERRRMTDEELGPEALAAFNRAKKLIDNTTEIQDLPVSPIDWMHKRLRDAGYTSGEITGRDDTIEYRKDGSAIYKLRAEKEKSTAAKTKALAKFNNGGLDAMILNRSGSTGLSMHASEKFKDQRQRHMIIAQAEGNIDTHMQMLGRIFRTGQVELPIYSQLVADIPAEKRPAAILAKKMASLNANTTGARGSALTAKDSVDFLNDYGDEVVAQLMADLPEVHEKLGEPLEFSNEGGYAKEDAARKVTGRISMLPVAEQEELYHLIESGYQERLAQADAMGENALEAKTLPLDAKLVKRITLTEGAKGDSPFAAGSYAEVSDVKRVGKPFTSAEVRQQVADKVGNATAETPLASLAAQGKQNARAVIEQTMSEYRKYRDAEEAKMLENDTKESAREGRLGMLDGVAKRWSELADAVHIGGSYELTQADGSSLMGVVTDITRKKGVKMPTALGAWVAKIALADGARQTQIPFSKLALESHGDASGKIRIEPRARNPLTGAKIETMFDDGQSVSREQRVIVTGNLLSGFTTWKQGQIVHFTDNKGNVRQGIMMPRSFKLDEAIENAPVRIPPSKAVQFLRSANQAVLRSSDGAVQVQRWGFHDFAMTVAKSKAEGGKYFLDPDLRRLAGDFVSQGSGMRVMLNADQVGPAMALIERKFDQRFETTSHRKEALAAGGESLGTKRSDDEDLNADRLARGAAGSMTKDEVEQRAKDLIDRFRIKPKGLVVVQSAHELLDSDLGPNMRAAIQDGSGSPIASYYPATGKIYVVADAINSPAHLAGVIAHEMVVHFGLRSMLGSPYSGEYRALLANIAKALPAATDFHGRREIPNYDPSKANHRQLGAEEALAYYEQAQTQGDKVPPQWKQWIQKLHQIVRDWLRKIAGLPEKFDDLYVQNVLNALRKHLNTGVDRSEEATGRPLSSQPKDTFYSSVERAVDSAKRDKGTGAEWEATLRNTPGVKSEEMEWLGLKDWLEGRGRVSRQEVADYVRAHRLQLGEKLLGMGAPDSPEHMLAVDRWIERNVVTNDMSQDQIEEYERLVLDAHAGNSRAVGDLETLGVPEHLLAPFYDTKNTAGDIVDGPTKWAEYVAPGGRNYREMLLMLPERPGERGPQGWGDTGGGTADSANYLGGHWNDTPNVLVHARFDERNISTGERTMHIAEIQSDWHHAGWKHGYRTAQELAAAREKQQEFIAKREALRQAVLDAAVEHGMAARDASAMLLNDYTDSGTPIGPGSADWQQRRSKVPEPVRAAMLAYHATNSEVVPMARLDLGPRVPDAPFKTTWQDLALKRLLRYAVDKGFDALSWDTGQTVADRFNLSKRIDSVALRSPGTDFVAYGPNGERVHQETGMTRERAAELLGKDVAERLYSTEPQNGWRQLSGLDLNTGAEGKKAIYDKMLPQKMAKIVKPWGGKVESDTVETSKTSGELNLDLEDPDPGTYAQTPTTMPVHVVRITPQMRASVQEGLPLFARPMFARSQPPQPNDPRTFLGRPGLAGKAYDIARKTAMFPFTNQLAMDVRKLFNPRSLSDMSKLGANRMVPFLADLARQKEIALANLEQYSREVDKLSYQQQLQAYHEAETGQRQSLPQMQPIMDALQKMLRDKAEQVQAMGPGHLDTFIDNYLPHYYTDPDKAKKFFAGPFGRRPLRGPATFKKQRYYATLRDAMEQGGLTPLTANPLIQTFLKLYEMDRYMAGVSMLRDGLKPDGLAKYFPIGKPVPEGWVKIDDPIARVSSWSEAEQGFVQRGYYAMPEDAGRLLNNHLGVNHLANFSPAMTLRALANSMTMFQLGFSGFHVGFTSTDAIVSKTALAYERMFNGEPGRAAMAFLESLSGPAGVLMNLSRGRLLQRAYLNPKGATPELQVLANAFVGGGGRIRMPVEYQTAQGISPFHGVTLKHLVADLKAVANDPAHTVFDYTKTLGNVGLEYANKYWRALTDMARTNPAWKLPFEALGRTVRMSTAFIMEKIVPWQKQGVFVDMARDYLRRNPSATPTEVNEEMQRITHSIDNRLGEVVYDNNFWNRSFKMAMHLSLRAVGWRFGTIQELAGGAHDFIKAADTLLRTGRLSPKDFTHKMAYLMGLMTLQAISGALLQYLMTGEAPKELKDVMFPRTGYLKKDGSPERLSLPTYVKDMYGYLTQPGHEIASMLNPILGELYYQIQNADYFGDPIYDPDDSGWEQFTERAEHFVRAYTPFVVEGTQHLEAAQKPGVVGAIARVGNFFGLKPAPKSITNPEAVTEREHYEDEKRYQKELRFKLKTAREEGDKKKVQELQQELQHHKEEAGKEHTEYMERKTQTEKKLQKQNKGGRTSGLIDKVGPIIDGSSSRAEMAQRIQQAGYPALAGLIGSLPDNIRPQVRARLAEYA